MDRLLEVAGLLCLRWRLLVANVLLLLVRCGSGVRLTIGRRWQSVELLHRLLGLSKVTCAVLFVRLHEGSCWVILGWIDRTYLVLYLGICWLAGSLLCWLV